MQTSVLEKISESNFLFFNDQPRRALEVLRSIPSSEITHDALIHRGCILFRLREFEKAGIDFQEAIQKDPKRYEGHYNSGKAAFMEGRYPDAGSSFDKAKALLSEGPHHSTIRRQLSLWVAKVEAELSTKTQPGFNPIQAVLQPTQTQNSTTTSNTDSVPSHSNAPIGKISYTWSQTDNKVYIEIHFALKSKEDLKIKFETNKLDLTFPITTSRTYEMELDLLDEIEPEKSRYDVHLNKIEVVLEKKNKSKSWKTLETIATDNEIIEESKTAKDDSVKKVEENSVRYPSSAKMKRDWGKIDKEIDEDMKIHKDDYYQEEDPMTKLFKEIYKNADEDKRRAMIKSFQTSSGTVLSTSWDEVKVKDYEGQDKPSAPQGQEYKKNLNE